MRKWVVIVLLVVVFVCSKINIFAVDGACGGSGEPCCFINNKLDCNNCTDCVCVQSYDSWGNANYNCKSITIRNDDGMVTGSRVPNTCECEKGSFITGWTRGQCVVSTESNFCDATAGKQAFCRYTSDLKCGSDISSTTNNYSCECATPSEAANNKELNGYYQYYKAGTCFPGGQLTLFNKKVWVEQDYCDNGKVAKLYSCSGKVECNCVDPGYTGKMPPQMAVVKVPSINYCSPVNMSYVVEKPLPGQGFNEFNTEFVYGTNQKLYCEDKGNDENPYIRTALGCIPISMNGFISWIVPNLFGIIGGIAFLIMIYGFIMMSASDGDPKKAQAAKETITAAITGLLLSIFAIFLVRLIMLYILKLPGVK